MEFWDNEGYSDLTHHYFYISDKCVFWGSVVDADILTVLCIVYGCSIADGNSEVSESESASEMNQFWPYSA